jgi:hypothetical protein
MRSKEDVKAIVESAFAPLRAVAELSGNQETFAFRVYGPDNEPIISFAEQPIDTLRSGPGLEVVIVAIRKGVERKGFTLFPWSLGQ